MNIRILKKSILPEIFNFLIVFKYVNIQSNFISKPNYKIE